MMAAGYAQYKADKLEDKIEQYNRRLEEIIKSSPFPIVISRLTDDKILMANDNAVKLFGLMPNELERYRLRDFFCRQRQPPAPDRASGKKRKCMILKSWQKPLTVKRLSGC